MEFNKKMSKSGAITLPAVLRREYGLADGEKLNIVINDVDGTIVIQRTQGQCIFCSKQEQLIVHHGRLVCMECVDDMNTGVAKKLAAEGQVQA